MGWIKLDHVLLYHPKVMAAQEAYGLYCQGLLYADFQGSDGFIADHIIPTLLPALPARKLKAKLIEVGLWDEVPGGVEISNYLKHNRSADEVADLKQKRAEAGAKGGSHPKANSKHLLKQTASKSVDDAQAEKNREEETREEKSLKASSQAAPDDLPRFEDFWSAYPRQVNGTKPEPKLAKDQWAKLKPDDQVRAFVALMHYRRHLQQNPDI